MHQCHAWFLSETFVIFQFRGIFLWHSSLHSSHSKLSEVMSCLKKRLKEKFWGQYLPFLWTKPCQCITYSYFRDSELGFSHTGLNLNLSSFWALLTPWSGVPTPQGRRALRVKCLTAGPCAAWKQKAIRLLRCLQKHSHDFTAKLSWRKLPPTQGGGRAKDCLFLLLS